MLLIFLAALSLGQNSNPGLIPAYRAVAGEKLVARSKSGESPPLARHILAAEEYLKYSNAKDSAGLKELENEGQLVFLDYETTVLILEEHEFEMKDKAQKVYEVRVLDKKFKGRTGFVPKSFLFQKPPTKGDKGILEGPNKQFKMAAFPSLKDVLYYQRMTARGINEALLQFEMRNANKLANIDHNTRVTVIGFHRKGKQGLSDDEVEVRIDEGRYKGQRAIISLFFYRMDKSE